MTGRRPWCIVGIGYIGVMSLYVCVYGIYTNSMSIACNFQWHRFPLSGHDAESDRGQTSTCPLTNRVELPGAIACGRLSSIPSFVSLSIPLSSIPTSTHLIPPFYL